MLISLLSLARLVLGVTFCCLCYCLFFLTVLTDPIIQATTLSNLSTILSSPILKI